MKSLTDYERGWLAGIIDGEGTLYLWCRTGERPSISFKLLISNTNTEIINETLRLTENQKVRTTAMGEHKPIHTISIPKKEAVRVLNTIRLISKENKRIVFLKCAELTDEYLYEKRPRKTDERLKKLLKEFYDENERPVFSEVEYGNDYWRGWLDGIIVAEGCLGCYKHGTSFRARLHIANNDKNVIETARKILKCGIISYRKDKRAYSLVLSENMLREILPGLNLVGKQTQQKNLLRMLELKTRSTGGWRWKTDDEKNMLIDEKNMIVEENKCLNRKGV